jgi:hypothetical protein
VGDVAGGRRDVACPALVDVSAGDTFVHPAQHRLDQQPVVVEEGSAESEGLGAYSGYRVPDVVVRMYDLSADGRVIGPKWLLRGGVNASMLVDYQYLRALRAAVDRDDVVRRTRVPGHASNARIVPAFITPLGSNALFSVASMPYAEPCS